MLLNNNVIENCLYATYSMDFWIELYRRIKDEKDDTVKEKYSKHCVLLNEFLLRRVQDPGFYEYVNSCLVNDKVLKQTKDYIRKKYFDSVDNLNFKVFAPFPNIQDSSGLIKHSFENPLEDNKNIQKLANDIFSEIKRYEKIAHENMLIYIEERYQDALRVGDEDAIKVMSLVKNEQNTMLYFLPEIFNSTGFYNEENDKNWAVLQREYLLKKLRFIDIYGNIDKINTKGLLHTFINSDPQLVDEFYSLICELEGLDHDKSGMIKFNKFIVDSISIASVIWFNYHTEEEKIEILNREYKFFISDKFIKDLSSISPISLLILAQQLYWNQYYDDAKKIYLYLSKEPISPELKHVCLDGVACIYRENKEYGEALTYFIQDYEQIREYNNPYQSAVCLKNIGETYCHLGNRQNGDRCFTKARSVTGLSEFDSLSILKNISVSYSRLRYYESEDKILNEIIEHYKPKIDYQEELKVKIFDYAQMRLNIISHARNPYKNFSIDKDIIAKYEKMYIKDDYSTNLENGKAMLFSFQFDKSRQFYLKSYNEKQTELSLENIIKTHLMQDNGHEITILADIMIKQYPDYANGYAYKAITLVKQNQLEALNQCLESIIKLKSEYQTGFTSITDIFLPWLFTQRDQQLIDKILENISGMIDKNYGIKIFYSIIGDKALKMGLIDTALYYFKKDLSNLETRSHEKIDKFNSLMNIGTAHMLKGEYKKAIPIIEKALENYSEKANAWAVMSRAYKDNLEINNAIRCIDKAIELTPDIPTKKQFEILRTYYEKFSGIYINFNAVKDQEVKNILESAEKTLFKISSLIDEPSRFDFSMALIYYGKAIEIMLNREITLKMREAILQEYGGKIPSKYWKGNLSKGGKIPKLPKLWRDVLSEKRRTITTGQWSFIFNDFQNYQNNKVVKDIDDYLTKNHAEKLLVIGRCCFNLYELRNESAHAEMKNWDEVVEARKNTVENLNLLIEKIYK